MWVFTASRRVSLGSESSRLWNLGTTGVRAGQRGERLSRICRWPAASGGWAVDDAPSSTRRRCVVHREAAVVPQRGAACPPASTGSSTDRILTLRSSGTPLSTGLSPCCVRSVSTPASPGTGCLRHHHVLSPQSRAGAERPRRATEFALNGHRRYRHLRQPRSQAPEGRFGSSRTSAAQGYLPRV